MQFNVSKERHKFLDWLRVNNPRVYSAMMDNLRKQGLSAYGDELGAIDWGSIASSIEKVAPAAVQAKAQYDVLKTQLKLAKQGKPPLDASQMTTTMRVQGGIDPALQRNLLISAAVGLGALLLVMRAKRR